MLKIQTSNQTSNQTPTINQSKKSSLVEQLLNVGSGFIISLFVWTWLIVPVMEFEVSAQDNVLVTLIFTVISIIRGYAWRRIFNKLSK